MLLFWVILLFLIPALIVWSPVFTIAFWLRPLGNVGRHVWIWAWIGTSLGTVLILALTGVIHEVLSWQ
ncbi:hypothetical protein SAMN05518849_10237 [Sphingobium sp. AP50]|uniref:hypothetical protein n=1 Tax=Sphingobium sp. AP50 TaxID=1884369 RepID=UPI0008CBA275|nr:hypothetical protein [Sphingobium sp. AP50]SEI97052.1 hypothetical protein SAMN05518849_10237 [Sphingobium sp. AP50]